MPHMGICSHNFFGKPVTTDVSTKTNSAQKEIFFLPAKVVWKDYVIETFSLGTLLIFGPFHKTLLWTFFNIIIRWCVWRKSIWKSICINIQNVFPNNNTQLFWPNHAFSHKIENVCLSAYHNLTSLLGSKLLHRFAMFIRKLSVKSSTHYSVVEKFEIRRFQEENSISL